MDKIKSLEEIIQESIYILDAGEIPSEYIANLSNLYPEKKKYILEYSRDCVRQWTSELAGSMNANYIPVVKTKYSGDICINKLYDLHITFLSWLDEQLKQKAEVSMPNVTPGEMTENELSAYLATLTEEEQKEVAHEKLLEFFRKTITDGAPFNLLVRASEAILHPNGLPKSIGKIKALKALYAEAVTAKLRFENPDQITLIANPLLKPKLIVETLNQYINWVKEEMEALKLSSSQQTEIIKAKPQIDQKLKLEDILRDPLEGTKIKELLAKNSYVGKLPNGEYEFKGIEPKGRKELIGVFFEHLSKLNYYRKSFEENSETYKNKVYAIISKNSFNLKNTDRTIIKGVSSYYEKASLHFSFIEYSKASKTS